MHEIQIQKYSDHLHSDWDLFIDQHIGIFLFTRKFIRYHKDRFIDHSLLFYKNKSLIAVLPAWNVQNQLYSHPGLTFGGILFKKGLKNDIIHSVFKCFDNYVIKNNFERIIYKSIPSWYTLTAEHYYLHQSFYQISRILVNHIIDLNKPLNFNAVRRREIKKFSATIDCRYEDDVTNYYPFLERNIAAKFQNKPLHSLEDLMYLLSKFPQNIKAFCGYLNDNLVGLIILFIFKKVVKCQYISSSIDGNNHSIIPVMMNDLIDQFKTSHSYLDLGTSMIENDKLNHSLAWFKESIGAIPVPVYIFEKEINT